VAATAILALALAAAIGGTAGVLAYGSSCDLDSLQSVRIGQNTFLYAADGSLLGSIPAERNRQPVTAEGMSLWIRKATIAVEDRRFFAHDGVDLEGIARAAVADIRAGEIVEGGSTITQQLVRNLYISRERTVQRKVKEACLATKLDGTWTKHRILTTYLNQVYYGNQAYGIEAAAQTYYSKPAKQLRLA
jgi:penicillin-binding protein 1A